MRGSDYRPVSRAGRGPGSCGSAAHSVRFMTLSRTSFFYLATSCTVSFQVVLSTNQLRRGC